MKNRMVLDQDKELGRRLRDLRRERNITQEMLSAALDISYQQLQKIESGKNRLTAYRLLQCSRILEVPVWKFYQGIEVRHG